jgi:hypothetical protein
VRRTRHPARTPPDIVFPEILHKNEEKLHKISQKSTKYLAKVLK